MERRQSVNWVAGHNLTRNLVSGRVGASEGDIAVQIVHYLTIGVDDCEGGGKVERVIFPGRGDNGNVDDVELIGVREESH